MKLNKVSRHNPASTTRLITNVHAEPCIHFFFFFHKPMTLCYFSSYSERQALPNMSGSLHFTLSTRIRSERSSQSVWSGLGGNGPRHARTEKALGGGGDQNNPRCSSHHGSSQTCEECCLAGNVQRATNDMISTTGLTCQTSQFPLWVCEAHLTGRRRRRA